jgi:hypothetical protein
MIATFIKKGPCVDIGMGYAVEIGIARPTAVRSVQRRKVLYGLSGMSATDVATASAFRGHGIRRADGRPARPCF